jgi:hypothetical protein
MPNRLSSRWTFAYKYLFPTLWIPAFGLATVAIWVGRTNEGDAIPTAIKLFVFAAWIVGSLVILWLALRLWNVQLESGHLIVSNGSKEIRIPITQIEDITETRLWNPKMIKISLGRSSDYPDQIVFLAPMKFQFTFSDHPMVGELRAAVERAKRERSGSRR